MRQVIAVVLLALWLPATQHCGLEGAGVFSDADSHEHTGCGHGDLEQGCSHDGCKVVESNFVKPSSDASKVSAPALFVCVCLVCLGVFAPPMSSESGSVIADADGPQAWLPQWSFDRRAALPARAPSLVLA